MLKVININPDFTDGIITQYYTADSIEITADSIDITADAISYTISTTASYYSLVVPYRVFYSDVYVYLKDELTLATYSIDTTATEYTNGTLGLSFSYDFQEGDSFEAAVRDRDNNILLWRGKIYATEQEDLQNFKLNNPDDNGIIKI